MKPILGDRRAYVIKNISWILDFVLHTETVRQTDADAEAISELKLDSIIVLSFYK